MKLKRRKRSEDRDPDVCATSRCAAAPTIIIATKELDDCDVPLCDKHWQQHCDEQEAEHERQSEVIARVTNPKPPRGLKPGRYNVRYTDDLELEVIP